MSNPENDPRLPGFPVITSVTIEWGQQDAFGHINNIHHFRWFETGRIDYLTRLGVAVTADGVGPILAAISCNYRRQIQWQDQILIGTRITKIGTSSLTVGHAIWSRDNNGIAADGDSTVVMFDYGTQTPYPVSDELRRLISQMEGKSF